MNDPKQLDMKMLNREAALNTLVAIKHKAGGVKDGDQVKDIIAKLEQARKNGQLDDDQKRKLDILQNAIRNDKDMGNLIISNQSSLNSKNAVEKVSACTFQDSKESPTSVIVVFSGTQQEEWIDNGIGLAGEKLETPQQKAALDYYERIVEENGWDQTHPNINMTGHSKGGNRTQYTIMMSKYSDLISSGYSFDGQGMSQEALEMMKEKLGETEFNRRRQKLFSISADNDYVNVWGTRLVPEDHIFYLKSNVFDLKYGIVNPHSPDCYMYKDRPLTEGDFCEQSLASKYLEELSKELMQLPPEIRSKITIGLMEIAQGLLGGGKSAVGGEELNIKDMIVALDGVLLLIGSDLSQREKQIIREKLTEAATQYYSLLFFYGITNNTEEQERIFQLICRSCEVMNRFRKTNDETIRKLIISTQRSLDHIQEFRMRSSGVGATGIGNSEVRVDTAKLRNYADRIESVRRRANTLDNRMDSLYKQIGLQGLWNLMVSNEVTCYNYRLSRCSSYLRDTAADFENIEADLNYRL